MSSSWHASTDGNLDWHMNDIILFFYDSFYIFSGIAVKLLDREVAGD